MLGELHVSTGAARPGQIAGARSLYTLRLWSIWRFLKKQPVSYWLICLYLFFEYVRPQSIYQSIDLLPWAFLSIVLCSAAFLVERRSWRLTTPADWLLVLFGLVVLAASAVAYSPATSLAALPLFVSWIVIYILISNVVITEQRFLVFILSFLLYNLKMSLHATRTWAAIGFAFRDWGVLGAPGWFHNSGEFGIEMTMFLPISVCFIVALRRYWSRGKLALLTLLPATSVIGMLASASRGALLGGAAVLFWFLMRSRHRVRTLIGTTAVVIAAVVLLPNKQKERLTSIGTDPTSVSRLTYWKDGIKIANEHPILGVGYANWGDYYRRYYNPRGQLPHNIFVEAGAELGYTGLLVFGLLIAYTFVVNSRTRKIARQLPEGGFLFGMTNGLDGALVGYLVSGFFVTVLYYPFFWINLAMTVALHKAAKRELRQVSVA
jgi:putative inorganic carbon (HCO3(-)) transporter